jgi:hypothetical protein
MLARLKTAYQQHAPLDDVADLQPDETGGTAVGRSHPHPEG